MLDTLCYSLEKKYEISSLRDDHGLALFGSVERFFGILVEHYAGAFPVWLAPVQVALLPVTDRANVYADGLAAKLKDQGFRVEIDKRNEKVNFKIREAQLQKVPYMLVIGDREVDAGTVSVRNRRHGDLGAKPFDEFVALLSEANRSKTPVE